MDFLTDIGTLRGIATILVFIAFIAICIWAYLPSREQEMKDAANLPFEEDEPHQNNK